jgi:hypothetical protein
MSKDEEKNETNEVAILANALADSNREANSSNKNTVRVLGILLAFSVLGNFALAGLNISGNFMGTDIKMGHASNPAAEHFEDEFQQLGYQDPELPPFDWCAETMGIGDIHPDDVALCIELYPELGGE